MGTDPFSALSELSKLGKKSKEEQIGDLKLTIHTLDAEQEGDVFIACSELSGNAYFNKLKSETLKYAIRAVNGQRLDEYLIIEDEEKREQMKTETLTKLQKIIGTWDENIISFLYSKWTALSKESEEELKKKGLIV